MRLTLRTLLAYLDDRLAPNQAKEIGQKVTTSPFATELAERIKDVVRRRRLAKASAGHKSIDANLIAEYLDDQLTPELVALIEKEILTSDSSLAEVAATHQIIGMLNDPIEIATPLKERLHRLGPQPDAENEPETSSETAEWKPLEAQTIKQKRSPMFLLGAMVLGWLVLVATDSDLFRRKATPSSASNPEPAKQDDPILVADAVPPPAGIGDTSSVKETIDGDNTAVEDDSRGSDPVSTGEQQPMKTEDPTQADASNSEQKEIEAATGNLESPGEPPAESPVDTASPSAPDPDPADARKVVSFNVDDEFSMLLRFNPEDTEWSWASQEARLAGWNETLSGSLVGIPGPFSASVSTFESGWSTIVRGQTLLEFAADGTGVLIVDGAVVVRASGTQMSPPAFMIESGGTEFSVSMARDDARAAVAVSPLPIPIGAPQPLGGVPHYLPVGRPTLISVFAADAEVTVEANGQKVAIPTGAELTWRSDSEKLPVPVAATVPEWAYAITKTPADSTVELLKETATSLQSSSVSEAADELLESRNPLMAEYAVSIPSLTRQLDSLCSILLDSEQTGVRRAAIVAMNTTILTSPGAEARVSEILRTRLTEIETKDAMKLIGGISPVEAEDRFVSAWLVNMLENSRASLRELAIFNLERLTGAREGFQTDDEATRRGSSVRRWKKRLSRNDGRLVTPPG